MDTRPRRGRPPKLPAEKYIEIAISLPPEVAERLRVAVPARERSAYVAGLIRGALARDWREGEAHERDAG